MAQGDVLSMVAFDDEVMTVFQPEKVTHKDLMKRKIAFIVSGKYEPKRRHDPGGAACPSIQARRDGEPTRRRQSFWNCRWGRT
jgi:hypothetical protein